MICIIVGVEEHICLVICIYVCTFASMYIWCAYIWLFLGKCVYMCVSFIPICIFNGRKNTLPSQSRSFFLFFLSFYISLLLFCKLLHMPMATHHFVDGLKSQVSCTWSAHIVALLLLSLLLMLVSSCPGAAILLIGAKCGHTLALRTKFKR